MSYLSAAMAALLGRLVLSSRPNQFGFIVRIEIDLVVVVAAIVVVVIILNFGRPEGSQ
jgi:hypothetical protein